MTQPSGVPPQYRSDRWVTPGVIVTALLVGAVVVLGITGAVAYLAAQRVDSGPMLQLVGILVAAAGSAGSFLLQLINRATVAKTERNTGVLANAVLQVHERLDEPAPPPAPTEQPSVPQQAPQAVEEPLEEPPGYIPVYREEEQPTSFAASYERPPVPPADDYPTACGGRRYREPRIARD